MQNDTSSRSDSSDSGEEGGIGEMFPEEERPPTPPSSSQLFPLPATHPHHPSSLTIHLVSDNPLWGHLLWNASRSISDHLSDPSNRSVVADKNVIEFGAGGGLPGLICAGLGANRVVITDYPEAVLLNNISRNVRENGDAGLLSSASDGTDEAGWQNRVLVEGHVWGKRPAELLSLLPSADGKPAGFDLMILSDLIFNHSQHVALLDSMSALIRQTSASPSSLPAQEPSAEALAFDPNEPEDTASLPKAYIPDPAPNTPSSSTSTSLDAVPLTPSPNQPRALIFFSHHLPHHMHRDLLFFYRASQRGWLFRRVGRWKVGVMFEEDDEKLVGVVRGMGMEEKLGPGRGGRDVREIVEGWEMWRS